MVSFGLIHWFRREYFPFLLILVLAAPLFSRGQKDITGAYRTENQGYFCQLHATASGLVFSDNRGNQLYRLSPDGAFREVYRGAGCGRYLHRSPDGQWVGFKIIDSTGRQTPGGFNPDRMEFRPLSAPEALCGQPMPFEGGWAFTVGNELVIQTGAQTRRLDVGQYINLVGISPDGAFLGYPDRQGKLSLVSTKQGESQSITLAQTANRFSWAPDSRRLAFSDASDSIFILDLNGLAIRYAGSGAGFCWSPSGRFLAWRTMEPDETRQPATGLALLDLDSHREERTALSRREGPASLDFLSDSSLVYSVFGALKLMQITVGPDGAFGPTRVLYESATPPEPFLPDLAPHPAEKSLIDLGPIPYVHQLYDTPDFHDGSGSCGPATAVMALAWFNRLPGWPTTVTVPTTHTSLYGSYVADRYRFNEFYYNTYTSPYASDAWGAYSFMWASGSPSSTMKPFYRQHLLESSQSWTSACTFEKTCQEIDAGFPHTICSYMTASGHITLAKGYLSESHTLLFNDPYGNKNVGYPSENGKDVFYDWPGFNNGYQNLDPDGTHGGVAWTVTTRGSQPVYGDTLVDDQAFGHGFQLFNEPPSHQRFYRDRIAGFNQHFWYTLSVDSEDVCYAKWTPNLPDSGTYSVYAFIPGEYSDTPHALYRIHHAGGDTLILLDQSAWVSEWAPLGTFLFKKGTEGWVYLGDNTGVAGEWLAFDAVLFSRSASPDFPLTQPDELFQTGLWPNPAEDVLTIRQPYWFSQEPALVSIFDPTGRLIWSLEVRPVERSYQIQVSNLPSGLYFVRIATATGSVSRKFIRR